MAPSISGGQVWSSLIPSSPVIDENMGLRGLREASHKMYDEMTPGMSKFRVWPSSDPRLNVSNFKHKMTRSKIIIATVVNVFLSNDILTKI